MRSVKKRQKDILELLKKLDISPTMFESAKDRYVNLGKYLQSKNPNLEIYPQGSFAIGTVIRPYTESSAFDLDFIINTGFSKELTTPKNLKFDVKNSIEENQIYREKLDPKEYDKCWTLIYADEFSMDIVPSTLYTESSSTEIAITNKNGVNYSWYRSNPKAYIEWFNNINKPFKAYSWKHNQQQIFNEYRDSIYSKIEEIPEELDRSALQRVIQIIKRHRDIYYDRRKKTDKKPSSVIITTLSAQIAYLETNKSIDIFDLLNKVVDSIEINTKKKNMSYDYFFKTYGNNYNQIEYRNNQWYLPNPINIEDNLVDAWNNDSEIVILFNDWIKQLKEDFVFSFNQSDDKFLASLNNSFGNKFVEKNINKEKYQSSPPKAISSMPKPWRS